jgi:hypothetical protein
MSPHPAVRFVSALAIAICACSETAAPHSVTVPFFRDDGSTMENPGPVTGSAGLITVWNTRNQPVTMYLVYVQNSVGGAVVQQAVTYTIGARRVVSWRPVQDDRAEGAGQSVPNVQQGLGPFGSVTIYWYGGGEMTGAIVGQYREFASGYAMMHVLSEEQ